MTHGTILLSEYNRDGTKNELILHAYHSGHLIDSVVMLLNIPHLVAKWGYHINIIKNIRRPNNKKDLIEQLGRMDPPAYSILELGHYISKWEFNRWYVMPYSYTHKNNELKKNYNPDVQVVCGFNPSESTTEIDVNRQYKYFINIPKDNIEYCKEGFGKYKTCVSRKRTTVFDEIKKINKKASTKIEIFDGIISDRSLYGICVPAYSMYVDKIAELVLPKKAK